MRPHNTLDWIAFVLLVTGALAWGYFVTDVNILDRLLGPIADPADDIAFVLIGAAGLYAIVRVATTRR